MKKPAPAQPEAPHQPDAPLGAERWLAVRQRSGAGPMTPKPKRGTRAEHARREIEDQQ
ncbi:MAG TPA: hypothetical protein VMD91_08210 [Candidatus Sulfotelmatobacter sp.]|nr:hypothetical protein [Candidatus Sulfotelmatobacter sp.]